MASVILIIFELIILALFITLVIKGIILLSKIIKKLSK